jgi:hypothetical protein
LVGRFVGVGREVGLPFAFAVADGVDVGTEVEVGSALEATLTSAARVGGWVNVGLTRWAGPLVGTLVGCDPGC